MDRYSYLEYTILLDELTLARLGNLEFLLHIHKNTITHMLINFLAPLPRNFLFIHGVYANINTKYLFGTLDICFDLILDTFKFSFVTNLQVC